MADAAPVPPATPTPAPAPVQAPLPARRGLVMVNTGDGKGKTTAALGAAFRALGHGWKVLVIQFIKGSWWYGELGTAARLGGDLEIRPMGEGFTWETKDRTRDSQVAAQAWAACREAILSDRYDLVVLDEINFAMKKGYVDAAAVIETLRTRPARVHVILTGRGAPDELIACADLVTEMKAVKHPFQQGIKAQPGIEY